jgi:hypothetical protein
LALIKSRSSLSNRRDLGQFARPVEPIEFADRVQIHHVECGEDFLEAVSGFVERGRGRVGPSGPWSPRMISGSLSSKYSRS